ncbi:uncharacterized protein LOC141651577 [Silene latifolia]|uniref:uncharacterized protein LOC141651577 n=1 Tax=Silene latifolia TaxID=37657 RepID=UPI003D78141B
MISANNIEKIRNKCGYSSGICISSSGRSWGLGIWWKDIDAQILSYDKHHIALKVVGADGNVLWRAVGIYGWPELANKHKTWNMLRALCSNHNDPMVLFGYLNEILSMGEKVGAWEGDGTFVRDRLDRVVATMESRQMYPNAVVRHFPLYSSEHCAILIHDQEAGERRVSGKGFKFETFWLSGPECDKVVQTAWAHLGGADVVEKVKWSSKQLKVWARNKFGNLKREIRAKEEDLERWKRRMPSADMLQRCQNIVEELECLTCHEELYWYTRAQTCEF